MFKIPEGATVWTLDAEPILQLIDGTVVWAANQAVSVNKEIFVKAEPADFGDLDFWRKKYAKINWFLKSN